jgi:hypothetical protein
MTYQLDTTEARKADNTGLFIHEIGKYIGKFTQAEDIASQRTGTKGLALSFETNEGQKARLSIYTIKANGEKIMGYQVLMAIMTCLQLRSANPAQGTVTHWNPDTRQEEKAQGTIYPDLQNKPIGLLLETEDYAKQTGGTGTRMVIKSVFQAQTELTASEILDRKTKPEQLARMVATLRHRPIKNSNAAAGGPPAGHPASDGGGGYGDDSDIPF